MTPASIGAELGEPPAPLRCAGCSIGIPAGYQPRAFWVEQLVFCNRRCFDLNASDLLRRLAVVLRHIATTTRGKAASLCSMALSQPHKDVPLL